MTASQYEGVRTAAETAVREHYGRVVASLIARFGDIELAEDALQDALETALTRWCVDGLPDNPGAWLLTTAKHRVIDRLRRAANFNAKQTELAALLPEYAESDEDAMDNAIPDERLRLIFTCCHPALAQHARVALTLKTLCGMSVAQVARAFLTPEITMAQRIVRAKRKIKAARIPYSVPDPALWPERMDAVLSVIYLIFNEGHSATSGDALNTPDLCEEAIRLAEMLASLVTDDPEVGGLLALLWLHDARRVARVDRNGEMVGLEDQDRTLWDKKKICIATTFLHRSLAQNCLGPYQIQAALSACHANAPTYAQTPWQEIASLYAKLHELLPSPVVRLNEAVALSYARGPAAGLAHLTETVARDALSSYQPYHAAMADMLRRSGENSAASRAYSRAIELSQNARERAFLCKRRDALDSV